MANCGPIESIKPLGNLTYLEVLHLYESTRISDGDLAPLLNLANLKDLRITNRKHYAPSVQAVQTKLGLTG